MDLSENSIPENLQNKWIWTKLEKISDIILGQSPPSATYNDKAIGLPFFQGKTEFGDFYPEIKKWCSIPKKIAEEGDILISVRAPVGPTNICHKRSCIGRGLAAIRPPKKIKPEYILYLMRTFERKLARKATGTTFKAISGNQLRSFTIPFAPIEEQKEIVNRIEGLFEKLDAGVEGLEKVKKQIKRYRQAVLKAAFSGELTKKWREKVLSYELRVLSEEQKELEKYKIEEPDLPELPPGWKNSRIKEIYDIIGGGTPSTNVSDYWNGDIPWITSADIHGIRNIKPRKNVTKIGIENSATNLVPASSIIIVTRVGLGKLALTSTKLCFSQDCQALIRKSKNTYSGYALYCLQQAVQVFKVKNRGTTIPGVTKKQLSELEIPMPPIQEQHQIFKEIEKRFSVADEVEKIVDESLKHAKRLRQSILRESFNGNLTKKWREEHPELISGENSAQALLEKIKNEREK